MARIPTEPGFGPVSVGGFLPPPPYLSGGQRRGFSFGLPAHRSFLGTSKFMIEAKKKQKKEPYIPGLKTPRLYG
jgi:hypothetical protein